MNTLIKVCNPYCGPCSKAHSKIEKLLEEIPNLKVKIIFTTPNMKEDFGYRPVAHFLTIAEQSTSRASIQQVLDDWYGAEKKDYELFATRHPVPTPLERQDKTIQSMFDWCNKMEVVATPTIFINGYQLHDVYNIDDLGYFLMD